MKRPIRWTPRAYAVAAWAAAFLIAAWIVVVPAAIEAVNR